jgi:hypothetical protein
MEIAMSELKQAFTKSESIKELAAALSKVQGAIGIAVKDSTNPFFKSRYADLASVWDACREHLAANKLAVTQLPTNAESGRVAMTTVLMHASGEWIATECSVKLVKDDPQAVGSALTYLRRYMLSAIVGIVADDDDGNHASGRQAASANGHVPPAIANRTYPSPPKHASTDKGDAYEPPEPISADTQSRIWSALSLLKMGWTLDVTERASKVIGRQIAPTETLEHLSEEEGRKLANALCKKIDEMAKATT